MRLQTARSIFEPFSRTVERLPRDALPYTAEATTEAGRIEGRIGVECLSWIRVITKKPEGLTIIASTSATHYTTKKNDEYGIYEAEKKAVCTSMGAGTHGTITSVAFDEDVEAVVYFQG